MRLDQRLAPLRFLAPHVEQREARARDLGDAPRVAGPHDREVHELFGLAAHSGADVEQEREAILSFVLDVSGVDAREGGAADAADQREVLGAGEDAGARVPGRHEGVGPALGHGACPDQERGIPAAHRLVGILAHADRVPTVEDCDVLGVVGDALEVLLDAPLVPHQQTLDVGRERDLGDALHHLVRRVVSAHGIDGDGRHGLRSLPLEPSPQHWRLDPPHEGLHAVHAQHGNLFTIHGHERRIRVHVDDLQAERHPASHRRHHAPHLVAEGAVPPAVEGDADHSVDTPPPLSYRPRVGAARPAAPKSFHGVRRHPHWGKAVPRRARADRPGGATGG